MRAYFLAPIVVALGAKLLSQSYNALDGQFMPIIHSFLAIHCIRSFILLICFPVDIRMDIVFNNALFIWVFCSCFTIPRNASLQFLSATTLIRPNTPFLLDI